MPPKKKMHKKSLLKSQPKLEQEKEKTKFLKKKWAQNYNTLKTKPNSENYQANCKNAKKHWHLYTCDVTLYITWWLGTKRKSLSFLNFLLWSRSRIHKWGPQKQRRLTAYSGNVHAKGKYRKSSRIFIIVIIWYARTKNL